MLSAAPPLFDVLRERLATARACGEDFDRAWTFALLAAGYSGTGRPRADWQAWRDALQATREGWRRAYEREPPTEPERALAVLAPDVPGHREAEKPDPGGACAHCEGPMPERRHHLSVYCSVRCRRDAAYEREKARGGRVAHARKDSRAAA